MLPYLDQPPPPRAQDAPDAPKDFRLLVVCAWLMIGLGGFLVFVGSVDTPEPATTPGQVQDVVRLELVGSGDVKYRYHYEIGFDLDGESKAVVLYSQRRLDVGDEVELNVDRSGTARLSTGTTADGWRVAGYLTLLIGFVFLIYGRWARRGARKPLREPNARLSGLAQNLTPSNVKLAVVAAGIAAIGAIWVGNTIQYWSYGQRLTTPIVSSELLGAESGVRVGVEVDGDERQFVVIEFRDWYANPDTVTVYPETDPLKAHSQFSTLSVWVAAMWTAVGLASATLVMLLLARSRDSA